MTKEQEEVINSLEKLINIRKNKAGQIKYDNCICSTTDLEIVLNMLKEKDAEIEKKDKMIDLILDFIYDIWCVCPVTTTHELDVYDFNVNQCADCEHLDKKCKSCLKQHFERKAEEN